MSDTTVAAKEPVAPPDHRTTLASWRNWMVRNRVAIVLGFLAVVAAWPGDALAPRAGLDPSWRLGLQLAHQTGIPFGKQVVFTYGPLAFAQVPSALQRSEILIYLVIMTGLMIALYGMTVRLLRRHGLGPVLAPAVTVLTMIVLPISSAQICEMLFLAATVTVVDAIWTKDDLHPAWWVAFGLLTTVNYQMKVSTGIVMLPIMLIGAAITRDRVRCLLLYVVSVVVSFVVLWAAIGQSFGQVWTWMSLSLQIAIGYGREMNVETPSLAWEYPVLLLTAVGLATLAFTRRRTLLDAFRERRWQLAAIVVICALAGEFILKQGFTRHDSHSVIVWFGLAYVLVVSLRWTSLGSGSRVAGISAVAVLLWSGSAAFGIAPIALLDQAGGMRTLSGSVSAMLSSSYQGELLDKSRTDLQERYQLPGPARQAVGAEPVTADPYEISAVWASGMTWRPSTVLQRYQSLTPGLDRQNAASLMASYGPTKVLQQPGRAIDGRLSLLESPLYMRQLVCGFSVSYSDPQWQVLSRSSDRCEAPVRVSTAKVAAGSRVAIPAIDPDREALLIAVEPERSILDQAVALAFKPISPTRLWVDDAEVRMIDSTAATPGLIYVPPSSGWSQEARVFAAPARSVAVSRPARVTVFRMTVHS